MLNDKIGEVDDNGNGGGMITDVDYDDARTEDDSDEDEGTEELGKDDSSARETKM